MLSTLSSFKTLVSSSRRRTESFVFYLHYRITFLMLMFACALITTRQFVGERIECFVSPSTDISVALINSYCWAASTYSVSTAYFKEEGIEAPHPGIGGSEDRSHYIYRNYYQYIHLVLFIQALLFYFPHLIWKSIDKNYMNGFFDSINACKKQNGKDKNSDQPHFESAAIYIEERWGTHNENALQYISCEVLSLVNLFAQSYLLDIFLNREFLGLGFFYGPHYNSDRLRDPITLFPLVTSCFFKKFGASGFADTIDALCVLPINALNVKIYLFIWVWFAVLFGLTLTNLLHLSSAYLIPKYRLWLPKVRILIGRKHLYTESYVNVLSTGGYGDWFVLSGIKSNMDSVDFSRLIENLWSKLPSLVSCPAPLEVKIEE